MNYPKIYENSPKVGQYVSIIITNNKEEDCLPIYIPDFGCEGIIPITSLTKKKKIRSINKIAPEGKLLPAIVEDVGRVVVVTRLNMNKSSEEYSHWEEQKNSSRVIKSLVEFFKQKGLDKEMILSTVIRPLVESNNTELNHFDFIKANYNSLELDDTTMSLLKSYMDSAKFVKKIDYTTKFGMVATSSVSEMVEKITPVVEKYKQLKIVIDNFPYFVIKSNSDNSNESDHSNFLDELNSLENKNFMIKRI